ncbi:MAG: YciK family oxidoreductase [Pseudomonadota bacterium]
MPLPHPYNPATDLLKDRVLLITGASRGIGRSAALAYARYGATCVLLGRQVTDLETLYDEILAAGSPEPAIYPLDLQGASAHDYDEMAVRLEDELGRLDGVLLNAAQISTLGPVEHADPEEFARVLHINVTSSFLLLRALLPALKAQRDAAVILTTSGAGRRGRAYWGAYAISKFATEGLMQVLADECADGPVRVNCLNPGPVRTRMRATAYPAEDPVNLATADSIMSTYLYLMGPDSAAVRGETLDAQPPRS